MTPEANGSRAQEKTDLFDLIKSHPIFSKLMNVRLRKLLNGIANKDKIVAQQIERLQRFAMPEMPDPFRSQFAESIELTRACEEICTDIEKHVVMARDVSILYHKNPWIMALQ